MVTKEKNELIFTWTIMGIRVYMGYRKVDKITRKDHSIKQIFEL